MEAASLGVVDVVVVTGDIVEVIELVGVDGASVVDDSAVAGGIVLETEPVVDTLVAIVVVILVVELASASLLFVA